MPRISLWNNGRKGADYKFIDRNINEYINGSGTDLYVYLYKGVYNADGSVGDVTTIQDVVFQENRDRVYAKEIQIIRGMYTVQDNDFDLRQFGFFMGGDTLFIEVHLNNMLDVCGRKIMAGDVIELPHQRDDALLDESGAINRFYVVEEASKASSGYSATWFTHIWRIKVSPMTGAQEYADILEREGTDPFGLGTGKTLGDVLTNLNRELGINEAIVEEAVASVKARNFETQQFYFVPGDERTDQLPWVWAGDGVPPNGAGLLGCGSNFPEQADDGAYYLKTNISPHQLYRKVGSSWKLQEVDYRMGKWSAAHRVLDNFLNNKTITTLQDGTKIKERVALSKAVRPPADF